MTTVTKMIEALLLDATLSNQAIVDAVIKQFPEAKTTTKSVASVASVMRRFGVAVPKRTVDSPNERVAELEAQVARLEMMLNDLEAYLELTEIAA
jgi:polyhydroxyalkanoate synthesis regulator phasin